MESWILASGAAEVVLGSDEMDVLMDPGVGHSRGSLGIGRARVESEHCSSLARPSGQRLDHPSGLSFKYLGRPRGCTSFATSSAGPSL